MSKASFASLTPCHPVLTRDNLVRISEILFLTFFLFQLRLSPVQAALIRIENQKSVSDNCPTLIPQEPPSYTVFKLSSSEQSSLEIDGRLDEALWESVPWSSNFVDISDPNATPYFETKVKMRYDDRFLYIGAYIQETDIWANQTAHDSVICYDNDFEVFIDPSATTHYYKEFEMNALNTSWDLCLNQPYLNNGYPNNSFEYSGYRSAVFIEGTINNSSDRDSYWTLELALPLSEAVLNTSASAPPRSGDYWRINFSRVEYNVTIDPKDGHYTKTPGLPEHNWVWSSMGVINMHLPERWAYIVFSDQSPSVLAPNSRPHVSLLPSSTFQDPEWEVRWIIMEVYNALIAFRAQFGYFPTDKISNLTNLLESWIISGECASVPQILCRDPGKSSSYPSCSSFSIEVQDLSGSLLVSVDDTRYLIVSDLMEISR